MECATPIIEATLEDDREPAADTIAVAGGDRMLHVTLLGLSIAVIVLSFVLRVRDQTTVVLPVIGFPLPETCSLKRTTGVECPGCGLTRSFISMAQGQWRRAWRFNPVGPFLFVIVAAQVPYRTWQLWRLRRGLPEWELRRLSVVLLAGLVVGLLAQWIVRLVS